MSKEESYYINGVERGKYQKKIDRVTGYMNSNAVSNLLTSPDKEIKGVQAPVQDPHKFSLDETNKRIKQGYIPHHATHKKAVFGFSGKSSFYMK